MRSGLPRTAALSTLLLQAAMLLGGCNHRQSQQEQARSTPLVFQALNLRQQDDQGRLSWRVTSPEARYDLSRHLVQARELRGQIFNRGQPLYLLQASHGTVINDGQVIQLEGAIRVDRFGPDPVRISASRMRWYPFRQRIELDRNAEALNPQLKLQAGRATLLLDQDRLELRDQPLLKSRSERNAAGMPLVLKMSSLDWSPGSGRLMASGPVLIEASSRVGRPGSLVASRLAGNTRQRLLMLQAPVRLRLPERGAWLDAQQTNINLANNSVASNAPFTAALNELQISGQAFNLALDQQLVTLPRGCRLQNGDASLQAGSCNWNWQSQRIEARGGVILQRSEPRQITRATSLNGVLGDKGLLVFSAPGSSVNSTLRLPPSALAAGPQLPAAEPIGP